MGFAHFNLSPSVFQALTQLGYAEPTPVQARVIPEAMTGKDVRACAHTGTGKTCAFIVPIIEKLIRHVRPGRPSVLILTPTRELAAQVLTVAQDLSRGTSIRTALVIGGANFNSQARLIKAGADIIVATPGRLIDHIDQHTISLSSIHTLVLDEADRMLDMGFLPPIRRIVSYVPQQRQTLFFSATYGREIQHLIQQFLKNPVVVDLAPSVPSANVTQMVYPVRQDQKKALLQALFELNNMTSALIFTRTKHGANKLLKSIQEWGKKGAVIHGNRSLAQRQQALQGFKDRRYQVLVATDIAARGIDVKDISHVINFDVPSQAEDYVHRIGRTGRAQAIGEAFTLVAPDEEGLIRDIERLIKKPLPRSVIPDFPYNSKPRIFPSGSPAQNSGGRPHHPSQHRGPHSGGGRHPHQSPSSGGRPPHRRWR